MGTVWVADHLSLGSQVAVKLMAPEIARCPGFIERFRREAVAAAQIKSPHVAQVFDHGITDAGVPYILMELLEGEELKRRISRLGPMSLHEIARVVRQVARALGRAHQLGIVHRDTFNGLVMPGAGARRGGAGVLIAGVALAGAAALGLGIPWMHRDPPEHGAPAADSPAARGAPDQGPPPEPPPAPPAEEIRAAALPTASTTTPPPQPVASTSPALPAAPRATRAASSARPQPRPTPAARTNARARKDRIGF